MKCLISITCMLSMATAALAGLVDIRPAIPADHVIYDPVLGYKPLHGLSYVVPDAEQESESNGNGGTNGASSNTTQEQQQEVSRPSVIPVSPALVGVKYPPVPGVVVEGYHRSPALYPTGVVKTVLPAGDVKPIIGVNYHLNIKPGSGSAYSPVRRVSTAALSGVGPITEIYSPALKPVVTGPYIENVRPINGAGYGTGVKHVVGVSYNGAGKSYSADGRLPYTVVYDTVRKPLYVVQNTASKW